MLLPQISVVPVELAPRLDRCSSEGKMTATSEAAAATDERKCGSVVCETSRGEHVPLECGLIHSYVYVDKTLKRVYVSVCLYNST